MFEALHFEARIGIFRAAFRSTLAAPLRHSLVLFGAGRPPAPAAVLVARAAELARMYDFDFELADIAETLRPLRGVVY